MQAIVLSEKLRLLEKWTEIKKRIIERYQKEINNPKVSLPKVSDSCTSHSYHIFCLEVDDRESFERYMAERGVPTIIHYPIPIHKTTIFDPSDIIFSSDNTDKTCDRIVSIPIHPFLSEEEVDLVISSVNSWTIF
jgi:dTDP-4-amino-4,6-dideoxygalactose transaminase